MTYREVLGSVAAQKIRSPGPANEVNWKSSMLFCQTLSEAIDTYGTSDLPNNFFAVIEPYINSILECATSERTQLSVQACRATGNLAKVLGKDMHPLLDRVLPVLIKHCASTKAVNQKSAAAAISLIIKNSTYSPRLLWHICQAFEEKNVGPRLQAPAWLLLILQEYPKSLSSDRDVDTIINSIYLGLIDADNNVRTKSRTLFWEYHKVDADGAMEIKGKLNTHALTALDNDPHNPNQKSSTSKPKQKDPARPDSSLAQVRKQAKQRLQEHTAATKQSTQSASVQPSVTSANFTFGHLELDDEPSEPRGKKPSRDIPLSSHHRSANNAVQPENLHISKPASRPISVHKKGASNDVQVPSLSKKMSAMDINNTTEKKSNISEGFRTSQNKKPVSTANTTESSGARSLLSGPVRRPRIVATPMNVSNSSSRPSSRTGHPQTNATAHEPTNKHNKDASVHSHHIHHNKDDNEVVTPSEPSQPLQQNKTSRKALRQELSSPAIIPDGKENADVYPNTKTWSPSHGTPTASHVQRVLDHATKTAEAAQQYIAQQDAKVAMAAAVSDSELKDARKALNTAIGLMQSDQMDYMGFRKLKNIICNHGRELIADQEQYNTILDQLLPRLASIGELVHRGDPRDMKHPTYIRQAILHMVLTLLKQYHPTWSQPYMGTALASMMLARCAYSRNIREFANEVSAPGQPFMATSTTVELIMDSMQEIILFCPSPLDVLNAVLDCLGAAEAYLIENAEELSSSFSADSSWRKAYASWDRYSKEERLKTNHMFKLLMNNQTTYSAPNHIKNLDGFKDASPDLPSKMPFLMETALKLITPLLTKARALGHTLYPMQEEMLGDLAQHLLTTYNALIRRHVMLFCEQLFFSYTNESKFWENFPEESDRNLLHYYLADVKQ